MCERSRDLCMEFVNCGAQIVVFDRSTRTTFGVFENPAWAVWDTAWHDRHPGSPLDSVCGKDARG